MLVEFKSTPINYRKEELGLKKNTLRKVDESDSRFLDLKDWEFDMNPVIRIINSETGLSFEREISDVTFWDGWCIISWK